MPPKQTVKQESWREPVETSIVQRAELFEGNNKMAETMVVRETEKLIGHENYYMWSLMMKVILRGEGMWSFIIEEVEPDHYPVTIDREELSEVQFFRRKALACQLLLLSISKDIVDTVSELVDPT